MAATSIFLFGRACSNSAKIPDFRSLSFNTIFTHTFLVFRSVTETKFKPSINKISETASTKASH